MRRIAAWMGRYLLRRKRQLLLLRAFRHRRELSSVFDRTAGIRAGAILLFMVVRNEGNRLPFFLEHYRRLGVDHFIIVDNSSRDSTVEYLRSAPDVSLWEAGASYRSARFGMDWLGWLMIRYGHGHWCVTVDADELLLLPHGPARTLRDLTEWLDMRGAEAMAALMLDLYPDDRLSTARCAPGADPLTVLKWFDAFGYDWEYQPRFGNISIRGGPRRRVFFAKAPERAPHLHKTPLIKWNRRYSYVSSTHIALPPRLNAGFDARNGLPTGVLLHTKFLDQVIGRSREDKHRREHFTHTENYRDYYDALIADPVLRDRESVEFTGWEQLEALGLMTRGAWR